MFECSRFVLSISTCSSVIEYEYEYENSNLSGSLDVG